MLTEIEKNFLKIIVKTETIADIWSINSVQKLFSNELSLEHIFIGFIVNEKLNGYHTECMFPNKYNQNSSKANMKLDKNKVYKLYLPDAKKYSTCFPYYMNAIDIIIAIDEAYEEVITHKEKTNIGYSSTYKMNIKILKDLSGKVYNAFPLNNDT